MYVDDGADIAWLQFFLLIAENIGSEYDLLVFLEPLSPPARVCRNEPGIVAPKVDLPDGYHPRISPVRCLYGALTMLALHARLLSDRRHEIPI